ncbi:CrcB-like protein-domain-containing protein [Lobosporangium transversale]|uniref:CrcB-like protein-domain-containing protein n=1 Tax=Lobosporangium transversale TaxID=64571 RepID=A0A1Y2GD65_9FUNG|nr:CrcB-like protein-domain-containing protein [Lobosporangium transversale]ORZ07521.1 CrcB-like protein-domain-containing protein [Lobosporangium transversale]|eukprot:XP_021878028.1 CrcB-like protein-domain-containing protein [Lobosporangium transversale]
MTELHSQSHSHLNELGVTTTITTASTIHASDAGSISLEVEEVAELPSPIEGEEAVIEAASIEDRPAAGASPLTLRPPRISILTPALIIPFSILGLLIRLGLVSIETFPGQQVFALAWPQFIGCMFMGLFVSTREWINQGLATKRITHKARWIGPFIYVGLSSGLCGSITTFSSWSLGIFVEMINPTKIKRHPLQNVLSALTELVVTLAFSMVGLQSGMHLGEAILQKDTTDNSDNSSRMQNKPEPLKPVESPLHWTILDFIIIGSCVLLWIGMVLVTILMPQGSWTSWRHVVFAICFAPPGAILRWYLSRFNIRTKQFPVGTFAANVIGSLILAALVCLQHSSGVGGKSTLICQVLSGLQDGFCGCLTTISTFALELKILSRRASYIYGVSSVVAAQLAMLIVLGSFVWTRSSTNMDDHVYARSLCSM